ncbi:MULTISPECIES: putative bifunctional diguanylate cyclase/phosphodiesterase [unclassified Variovorax]|uniref:putative bifunctional diguanylate cyclase/phosphodiesterase n=1 Tax=unclassified Variovorax TaxID=663243 RepID=UPI001317D237|nr:MULTISPECIES: EAL domain-containing protein [unclassified Variovorax]VTU43094.1 Bacteriophytochrome cph2 [Variovorax sp. SRS16]VTU43126.1 Bacteriophytochrome cph2 [Variovorax sp. PBL-E5]VTU43452.1 Bacteriophytochrome cph2 [Variovorax sp. PBL-H6]
MHRSKKSPMFLDIEAALSANFGRVVAPEPEPQAECDARDLKAILNASGALAIYIDSGGRILHASDASAELLAYPKEHLLRASLSDIVAPDHRDILSGLLRNAWARSTDEHARLRFTGGLPESVWLEVTIRPDPTPDGLKRFILFGYNVSGWVLAEESLKEESMADPLTGLGNRALMRKAISEHILTAVRNRSQFAVAILDLDGFKKINDSLGHDVGDGLLREVATRLKAAVRTSDIVARLGGDEFVLLLPGAGEAKVAIELAERVVATLRKPFHLAGCQLRVTTSLGLTLSGDDPDLTESSLMKRADIAMYQAKAQGKNRVAVFTPEMDRKQQVQFALEQNMFDAVQNGEFSLQYQPICAPSTGEVWGLEALMRWERPDGLIPPSTFIPLAEHNGLINFLGDWALRCACAQLVHWDSMGLHFKYISVNVSPVQFQHPAFVESVKRAIALSGVDARRLVIEITEGALMADPEHAGRLLSELRQAGVRFAVDDFGTGYSSLAYLQQFPLQALKIDRSFVAEMLQSGPSRTIVFAILSLARELGLMSVAEGVETAQQCALLSEHGCDFSQGWHHSKALPAAQLEQAITSGALKLHACRQDSKDHQA